MKKARLRLASNVWIHGNSSSSSKVFACSLSTVLSDLAAIWTPLNPNPEPHVKEYYFFFSLVFAFLFLFFPLLATPTCPPCTKRKRKRKTKFSLWNGSVCYGIPLARVFCHVHFTFFPSPLCYFTCLAILPIPHCYYANLAILIFERALPLKLQRADQVPKKAKENKWEREGRKRGGRGSWEECGLWKNKSGAVWFFGAGVSPDQKNKIKIQALYCP